MGRIKIGGIIQNTRLAQVEVLSMADLPGLAGQVMSALGQEGINIQFIIESLDLSGRGNLVFCVDLKDLEETLRILAQLQPRVGQQRVAHRSPVAILSVFGPHFREKPSIAGTMFKALGEEKINIRAISTSISTLSCVIDEELLPRAVQAVCGVFELP